MKTSGSVHGKIIIDNPARYVITNQKGYDNSCSIPIAVSFMTANTPSTKMNEKSANSAMTRYFLV